MSFREKSAWVQFISIFLVAGFFFLHVPWGMRMAFSEELFQGFLYCILALIVFEVVAHLIVALKAPLDARAPKDERERLIELKAIRIA